MKKKAIVQIITRKITDMQENTHGKKLTIFFTQIVKSLHYDRVSDILTKRKTCIIHSSVILTLTGTSLGCPNPNGDL